MDATRERERRALADLAKLASSSSLPPSPPSVPASQPPARPIVPKPSADSSGLIDLAGLMASQPSWLDDALAKAKAKAPPGSSLAPASFEAPRIETMATLAPPRRKRRAGWMLAVGVALGALGAAGGFVWHAHPDRMLAAVRAARGLPAPASAPAPVATPAPVLTATAPVVAAAAAEPPVVPPPPAASAEGTPLPGSAVASQAEAPAGGQEEPAATKGKHRGRHGAHGHHEAAAAEEPAPPPAKGDDIFAHAAGAAPAAAPAAPAPAPKKAARDDSPLGAALREAAGGDTSIPKVAGDAKPAEPPAPKRAPASDRPDVPSPSAVKSALQSQLSGARACVASAGGPSRVRVTFGSEGSVTGVDVSGAAASDPAMVKCLKAAMGKAQVPAFAQPSYSAAVNVRPD